MCLAINATLLALCAAVPINTALLKKVPPIADTVPGKVKSQSNYLILRE